MIQSGTYLNVVDNSGAKDVCCIKVSKGYRRRYADIGDVITVSVKALRSKRFLGGVGLNMAGYDEKSDNKNNQTSNKTNSNNSIKGAAKRTNVEPNKK